jgi:hypothetical protein
LTFCERQHSINKWCRHVKEFDHRTAISIGEKVYVYKRPNSSLWQCASYFAGKNRRTSAKEESLSPRPRKSPRTGTYSFGENSAQARSRAKRPFARCLSSIYTVRHHYAGTTQRSDMWMASIGDRAFTWSPFSGTWASQSSPQERSRNTEFTDTRKQLRNVASHQAAAPSIRKSSPCARLSRQRCATDGSTGSLISLNRAGHPPKSPTGHGSHQRNTKKLYEATRKRAQEPKLDRDKLLLYAQKYPRPVKFELLESLARTGAVPSNGKSSASREIKR